MLLSEKTMQTTRKMLATTKKFSSIICLMHALFTNTTTNTNLSYIVQLTVRCLLGRPGADAVVPAAGAPGREPGT